MSVNPDIPPKHGPSKKLRYDYDDFYQTTVVNLFFRVSW
jgi:hypothetical protein